MTVGWVAVAGSVDFSSCAVQNYRTSSQSRHLLPFLFCPCRLSDSHPVQESTARGAIELQGARIQSADKSTGRRHCIEIATVDRTYFVQSESGEELDKWLAAFATKVATVSMDERTADDVDCEGFMDKRNNYQACHTFEFV